MTQKVTPFLWFDGNAEAAMRFYVSLFTDSEVLDGRFRLGGQEFMVLNRGPQYRFNEAISLFIDCDSQEEVDRLWDALTAGGEPGRCGWLKDKYGLSWQVVPTALGQMLHGDDPARTNRVVQAMLQMTKIDIATLRAAYDAA